MAPQVSQITERKVELKVTFDLVDVWGKQTLRKDDASKVNAHTHGGEVVAHVILDELIYGPPL